MPKPEDVSGENVPRIASYLHCNKIMFQSSRAKMLLKATADVGTL